MICFQLLKSEYFLVSFLIFDSKHNIFGQDILGCHFRVWKKQIFPSFQTFYQPNNQLINQKKKIVGFRQNHSLPFETTQTMCWKCRHSLASTSLWPNIFWLKPENTSSLYCFVLREHARELPHMNNVSFRLRRGETGALPNWNIHCVFVYLIKRKKKKNPSRKAPLSSLRNGALCHTSFTSPRHPPFASSTPLVLAAISGVILGGSHVPATFLTTENHPNLQWKAHLLTNEEWIFLCLCCSHFGAYTST